jgi:hypothetical protein
MENLTYWAKIGAIYFIFLQTFILEAGGKWLGGGVPDWFAKQFGPSIMAKFPGLAPSFYGIACLETTVAVLFLASAVKGEFLPGRAKPMLKLAITAAAFTFSALAFGQRLTHEYSGAADLFFFFGASLVALLTVEREETRQTAA